MAFFQKFPLIRYDVNKTGSRKLVTNIMRRVVMRQKIKDQSDFFDVYVIPEGETPEMTANKFYGSSELHWVILLLNDIFNPYYDWPLSAQSMEKFLLKKYPDRGYFVTGTTGPSDGSLFEKGAKVWSSTGNARVRSWNPTFNKLEFDNVGGTFSNEQKIRAYTSKGWAEATISRIVEDNQYSLHHFEDITRSATADGNILDPLASSPYGGTGEQVLLGQTGGTAAGFMHLTDAVTFGGTILYNYLTSNDGSVTAYNTIRNYDYEHRKNEKNRQIKILRPRYIEQVVSDFRKLMRG
jgi:hypothetical protein